MVVISKTQIRNSNIEARNKFEYQMIEIQNFKTFEFTFLKIVSDFGFLVG